MINHTIGSAGINQTRGTKYADNDQTVVIEIADYDADAPQNTRLSVSFRTVVVTVKGRQMLELRSIDDRLLGVVEFNKTV
jgi:hypothetical protein